ncbi:MAG: hypothetical protein JW720_12660 [Sedimentisphaerales bacterium]|nr:hypothetical protein [Sedimentisphaerales bacterium]
MRVFCAAVLLILGCILSGCGSYYYQDGKTLTECKADFQECHAELQKYQDPDELEDPARFNAAYDYEHKFMDTCMEERGYKAVSKRKLPLRVKREDVDPWVLTERGLAGELD